MAGIVTALWSYNGTCHTSLGLLALTVDAPVAWTVQAIQQLLCLYMKRVQMFMAFSLVLLLRAADHDAMLLLDAASNCFAQMQSATSFLRCRAQHSMGHGSVAVARLSVWALGMWM